jgi:hypothetical protein
MITLPRFFGLHKDDSLRPFQLFSSNPETSDKKENPLF